MFELHPIEDPGTIVHGGWVHCILLAPVGYHLEWETPLLDDDHDEDKNINKQEHVGNEEQKKRTNQVKMLTDTHLN